MITNFMSDSLRNGYMYNAQCFGRLKVIQYETQYLLVYIHTHLHHYATVVKLLCDLFQKFESFSLC